MNTQQLKNDISDANQPEKQIKSAYQIGFEPNSIKDAAKISIDMIKQRMNGKRSFNNRRSFNKPRGDYKQAQRGFNKPNNGPKAYTPMGF